MKTIYWLMLALWAVSLSGRAQDHADSSERRARTGRTGKKIMKELPRRRIVSQEERPSRTEEAEITVPWIMNNLKHLSVDPALEPHETFESLTQQAAFLRKELGELVVERAKMDHLPASQQSVAVARALETERERIREQLKGVQSKIKSQISTVMEKAGFKALGPGSSNYEKGKKRISVRFDSGEILLRTID